MALLRDRGRLPPAVALMEPPVNQLVKAPAPSSLSYGPTSPAGTLLAAESPTSRPRGRRDGTYPSPRPDPGPTGPVCPALWAAAFAPGPPCPCAQRSQPVLSWHRCSWPVPFLPPVLPAPPVPAPELPARPVPAGRLERPEGTDPPGHPAGLPAAGGPADPAGPEPAVPEALQHLRPAGLPHRGGWCPGVRPGSTRAPAQPLPRPP